MNIKSLLFPFAVIILVAVISYYIGSKDRGMNSDHLSANTPIIENDYSFPLKRNADYTVIPRKTVKSSISGVNTKRIEAIEDKFKRKKQKIEEYYDNQFRLLQQRVETSLKKYDAADRAAYAWFTEQLKNTISTRSGYSNMSGYIYPSGAISAHGYYHGTTHTRVAGAPSVSYGHHVKRMNEAIDNLMYEFELDFELLKKRRACDLDDLEKEKALSLAIVRTREASQSAHPAYTIDQGIVTGIIYSEDPLVVMNGKVLHEGQSIGSVKIVEINRDSVEFEYNGNHWSQSVNDSPSTYWP